MLSVLAEAHVRKVPDVRKRSVMGLRDGTEAAAGSSMAGTGYMLYAAVVVRTMRNVRRGLERERYVANTRRNDCWGRAVEMDVRREDASGGIVASAC
jgi:hypothetical protein